MNLALPEFYALQLLVIVKSNEQNLNMSVYRFCKIQVLLFLEYFP